MFTLITNLILIGIGFLGFKLFGYLGSILLAIDIFLRYFDISDHKILLIFIIIISAIGYFWDRTYFSIVMYNILIGVGILLFFKILKHKNDEV